MYRKEKTFLHTVRLERPNSKIHTPKSVKYMYVLCVCYQPGSISVSTAAYYSRMVSINRIHILKKMITIRE